VSYPSGRHFLQIPGPTNVPDRVLRAIAAPTIDHRGPAFQALAIEVLELLGPVFGTRGPVVIYPASGTGAWEAALVNTLSPGDTVLAFETGHFATLWREMAGHSGLSSTSFQAIGVTGWTLESSRKGWPLTRHGPSKRCAWCTTRRPPG